MQFHNQKIGLMIIVSMSIFNKHHLLLWVFNLCYVNVIIVLCLRMK